MKTTKIPSMIYGTAWKEDETQSLTAMALEAGFRAVDTANQRKHYHEEGAGLGIQAFLKSQTCRRENLFIQTKFTYARGQDHRKPYDDKAPYPVQVRQSFESSLNHLGLSYLDSLVLHGPFYNAGVALPDLQVWSEMEKIHEEGKVFFLGISNIKASQLEELYKSVKLKPAFVQNRCFAASGWDFDVRQFCLENNIHYQGFSLLTANEGEISRPAIQNLATKYSKTIPQVIFRFSQQIGMIPLTGTTNPRHMKEDLALEDFQLTNRELDTIQWIARPE